MEKSRHVGAPHLLEQTEVHGNDEIAKLIGNRDWRETQLGDIGEWPQSLKSSLSICLHSAFPMLLMWGEDMTMLYNEAYARLIGINHPKAFGSKVKDTWAPIWEKIRPLLEGVLHHGETVYLENQLVMINRKGFDEECYFTFSYSPVYGESGKVSGIFVPITEKTEEVIGKRHLKTLRDLVKNIAEHNHSSEEIYKHACLTFEGNPYDFPFALIYGIENDGQVARRLALAGIREDHPAAPATVDITRVEREGSNNFRKVLQSNQPLVVKDITRFGEFPVGAWRAPSHEALMLPITVKGRNSPQAILIVGTNPHLQLNEGYRGFFKLVTDQLASEVTNYFAYKAAMKHAAELGQLFMQAPVAIAVLRGPSYVVEIANERMLALWGKTAEEVLYKPVFDGVAEARGQGLEQILRYVYTTGERFIANERPVLLSRNGRLEQVFINFVYEPLKDEDGTISSIVAVASEVTDLVQSKVAVEESEKQFRNLVMQSPIAMCILNGRDLVIELANKAMQKLWGKGKDVIGMKYFDLFPELKTQKYPQIIERVFDTGIPSQENESVIILNTDRGPTKYYLNYLYAPLFEPDGKTVTRLINTVADVTEQVNIRQKIEDAESRLRMAAEGTGLATWDLNLKTFDIIHSPRLAEIFGHSSNTTLTHKSMRSQLVPEDRIHVVEKAFDFAMKTGTYDYEARVVWPDESVHWIRTQGKVVYNNLFEPLRMVGTMIDITTQKVESKALEESELRYRQLVQGLPVAVYTTDKDGYITLYNHAAVKLWGGEPEDGRTKWCGAFRIYHLDGSILPHDECAMAKAVAEGRSYKAEVIVEAENGDRHHILAYPNPMFDSQGKIIGAMNVMVDITERKESELALQKSESKFRLLASSMPQLIWTGDNSGNLTYFNPSVYDYSGLTEEQLADGGWINIVHPDDREENLRLWNRAVETGGDFIFEHRFRRHDGEYRWQLSRAIAQRDKNGSIQIWIGTSTDIHDQKTQSEALEKKVEKRTHELKMANEKLLRTNAELEQFAYVSSHDLQEPLRKIQTFADLVNRNIYDSSTALNYINKIQSSAARMSTLIKDVLDFSRLSKAEEKFVNVDLNEILEYVKTDYELLIEQKNAKIIHDKLPVIPGIPLHLTQLFSNLIGNSLKFTRINPVIKVMCEQVPEEETYMLPALSRERRYLKLIFTDNGIGFEQKYADQIFTIFKRLNNHKSFKGTGIGLALCKKIVENHSGAIKAFSEPDKGATFVIYLPTD